MGETLGVGGLRPPPPGAGCLETYFTGEVEDGSEFCNCVGDGQDWRLGKEADGSLEKGQQDARFGCSLEKTYVNPVGADTGILDVAAPWVILQLKGDMPKILVRFVVSRSGIEAWRRLHHRSDPFTIEGSLEEVSGLTSPPPVRTEGEVMHDIANWVSKLHRMALRKNTRVENLLTDEARRTIMIRVLPSSMQKELKPHADRYPSEAALRNRIEEILFCSSTGVAAMIANIEEKDDDEEGDRDDTEVHAFIKYVKGKWKRAGTR